MHYLDYNEKKQHGTADFPIEYYYIDKRHPRYNMPFHWHKEPELLRILEGVLHLKLDDEELAAQTGDILFINEGVIHGGTPENCVYECVVFDIRRLLMHTDACKQHIRRLTNHQIRVISHFPAKDHSLRQTVDRLFASMTDPAPGRELLTMGALFELFGIICGHGLFQQPDGGDIRPTVKINQLRPVLEYIDANYGAAITLSDLSRMAGMSPKYFCRFFRSSIHRTPMDYLNYYRIERACNELSAADLSVTEIAYRCGFNDVCYFIKTFKKYKGITPKQYGLHMG